jgi:hypothetical protein
MTSYRWPCRFAGLVAVFAVVSGCSTDPTPPDLTGTVTFEGETVVDGQVYVIPDKEKGNEGKIVNASIVNGRYEIRAKDRPMPSGAVIFKVDSLVDGGMYSYKSSAELQKDEKTKDFAIKKSETKYMPPLGAPSLGGGRPVGKATDADGGKDNKKKRRKGKEKENTDKSSPDKGKTADEKVVPGKEKSSGKEDKKEDQPQKKAEAKS